MLGSILGNILLVLGSSFIAGGFRDYEGIFRITAAQTYGILVDMPNFRLQPPCSDPLRYVMPIV